MIRMARGVSPLISCNTPEVGPCAPLRITTLSLRFCSIAESSKSQLVLGAVRGLEGIAAATGLLADRHDVGLLGTLSSVIFAVRDNILALYWGRRRSRRLRRITLHTSKATTDRDGCLFVVVPVLDPEIALLTPRRAPVRKWPSSGGASVTCGKDFVRPSRVSHHEFWTIQ